MQHLNMKNGGTILMSAIITMKLGKENAHIVKENFLGMRYIPFPVMII